MKIGKCSACGRTQMLKMKRCYDCYISGYTKRSKNIPWKKVNIEELKEE